MKKEHMGLITWKNAPEGRILQSDVTVAKNYLSEKEIRSLERNVSLYFDTLIMWNVVHHTFLVHLFVFLVVPLSLLCVLSHYLVPLISS